MIKGYLSLKKKKKKGSLSCYQLKLSRKRTFYHFICQAVWGILKSGRNIKSTIVFVKHGHSVNFNPVDVCVQRSLLPLSLLANACNSDSLCIFSMLATQCCYCQVPLDVARRLPSMPWRRTWDSLYWNGSTPLLRDLATCGVKVSDYGIKQVGVSSRGSFDGKFLPTAPLLPPPFPLPPPLPFFPERRWTW